MASRYQPQRDARPTRSGAARPTARLLVGLCLLAAVGYAGCDSKKPPIGREQARLERRVDELTSEKEEFEHLAAQHEKANAKLQQELEEANAGAEETTESLRDAETRAEELEARVKALGGPEPSEEPTPEQTEPSPT